MDLLRWVWKTLRMFRAILNSVVLYPSDAVSTERLVEEAAKHYGIVFIRTTRKETPIIYRPEEKFPIGGSKVLRKSEKDIATVIGAGITLHEALGAYEALKKEGVFIRVIDLYSIKPIDEELFARLPAIPSQSLRWKIIIRKEGLGRR